MRDPVEKVVQRLKEQLEQASRAGVKTLELSAYHMALHAVVGSTLRHADLECFNLRAEQSVLANAALSPASQPETLSVTITSGRNPRSLVKNALLNRRLRRLRSLNNAVAAGMAHTVHTAARSDSLHTKETPLLEVLHHHETWCGSCTASAVESAFFRAMATPMRLVDLRKARQALEEKAADPTTALVADCYKATERMRSSTIEPSLVGRAREVEREITAATLLIQQTSYSVLEELESRAVFEHLSTTSDTFLSLPNLPNGQSLEFSLPPQTLATLWTAFCRAGVEGRSPRAAFLETADSFSVKRYTDVGTLEPLLALWEEAVVEKVAKSSTHRVVVSRRDGHIFTSSSIVSSFVAITSGRAEVIVTAVGPHTASLLASEGAATVLGEIAVESAPGVAAMTQSLIQTGGVLSDPLEAFQAAAALSASSLADLSCK